VLEAIDYAAASRDNQAFQVELKYRAHQMGFATVEVPIKFWDRVVGASKLPPTAAVGSAMRLLRLRLKGNN
jgi:dolichol-phosphate mannosyltransferase